MPKSTKRAGQNIRDLAWRRRSQALMSFLAAAVLIVLPFVGQTLINNVLTPLSTSSSPAPSWHLPPIVYAAAVVASAASAANGLHWWKRANHADQGARGEEEVAIALAGLVAVGWQIEYGLRLGQGLGDADIVCLSPRQKAYVIDVKSHRGQVVSDGKQLYRQMGKQRYPFEKNFLKQVMKQAFQVKQQKGLKFVTPIVAFSAATVSVPAGKIQGVYVVEKQRLALLLQKLG